MKHQCYSADAAVGALPLPATDPATDEDGCPERRFPLAEPETSARRRPDLTPFAATLANLTVERRRVLDGLLLEATLAAVQSALAGGLLTSVELVAYYLDRIARYDVGGLNAVMALEPHAPLVAAALDAERAAAGPRGPLHGIPVLLKDNIATGDGLPATAGAYALRDWHPARDAFLVARLREAGAIILGKTNLSEWANYTDPCLPNGYSAVGGQTHSPYGPFDPSGSSTGSAVAVAANLAAAGVGSETQGSIIWPARDHSLVGLKPSLGLVSRSGVVPLVDWMDTPGPFGRTVADVAALLTALAASGPDGLDRDDPAAAAAAPLLGRDFARYLSPEMARRTRVGVVALDEEGVAASMTAREARWGRPLTVDQAVRVRGSLVGPPEAAAIAAALESQGVAVVMLPADAAQALVAPDAEAVLQFGFGDSLNRFLSSWAAGAPARALADVVAAYAADPANRAPYGYRLVEAAANTTITPATYAALCEGTRAAARRAIDGLLSAHAVDALAGEVDQSYAAAGYPALAVPAGRNELGRPLGIVFTGGYLSEPQLLAAGAAFERAQRGRVVPDLAVVLATLPGRG